MFNATVILVMFILSVLVYKLGYKSGFQDADQFALGELVDRTPIAEQLAADYPHIYLSLITPITVDSLKGLARD
jgi:hypothetical protein